MTARRLPAVLALLVAAAVPAGAAAEEGAGGVPLRLTLAEAIARARAASARLGELRDRETAAEASVGVARAGRLPNLVAAFGYTRLSDVPELTLEAPGAPPRVIFPNLPDNWRSRLAAAVPLYTGGRIGHGVDAARAEREAAASESAAGESDLVLETAAAYWSLVTARESARVLGEALRAYDAHLKEAKDRAEAGMAARNEVLAVEVERARAELGRLRASNTAATANLNLLRLLGLAPGTAVEPTEPVVPPAAAGDAEALVRIALEGRPERRAVLARAAAAESRAAAEHAARLPQVLVSGGLDYANPNRRILPPDATFRDSWEASIDLALNLFDGGRAGGLAARYRAEASALRHAALDLEGRIRLEVEGRALELETALAAGVVAERTVDAAKENLRVASDRYREGLVPSSELLDAETALLVASLDFVAARASAQLARQGLDRAVGR